MDKSTKSGYLGFKLIGTLKLISGGMAIAFGIGVFRFLGHDPGPAAERIVTHLGLDHQNRIIHEVLSRITGVGRDHLRILEAGTFFYALLHTVEGIGLILERDWAGYLVIVATSSLIPFEIYEIARKFALLRIALFLLNVGIVIYLVLALRKEHQDRSDRPA
ncbi:MAG: DUF2127 domain-containing protein [Isosphaeraceae bacterium]